MNDENFKLGMTSEFPCNYLPNEQERLLIAVDERLHNQHSYTWLMAQGFRRSGEQSYRPHCPSCSACQSVRVLVNDFSPSKSQKRSLKRNNHFTIKYSDILKDSYYPLYENYINTCHSDGTMFPANYPQFQSFLSSKLTEQIFIETWHEQTLICVAVTDKINNALSAVYTFYHPDYKKSGLGVFSILTQIQYCQQLALPYLYLGYQIDNCKKMNYKKRYFPFEKYVDGNWLLTLQPKK